MSAAIVRSIGADAPLGYNLDMNFVIVPANQAMVNVRITDYPDESDPGPFPIPSNAPIENWPLARNEDTKALPRPGITLEQFQREGSGDRHLILVDPAHGRFHEFWQARLTDTGWQASQATTFDLHTNRLRPERWTSSDAAGLPILPSIVRYDEVARGDVNHALRVTVQRTRREYVYPARHFASTRTDPSLPRMGERLRLRARLRYHRLSAARAGRAEGAQTLRDVRRGQRQQLAAVDRAGPSNHRARVVVAGQRVGLRSGRPDRTRRGAPNTKGRSMNLRRTVWCLVLAVVCAAPSNVRSTVEPLSDTQRGPWTRFPQTTHTTRRATGAPAGAERGVGPPRATAMGGPAGRSPRSRLDLWEVIGPGGGGTMTHPTISPHDPNVVLVGCDMTGGYITYDGGESWRMFNLGTGVSSFAFDPAHPDVIYASNPALWRSADRGRTWRMVFPDPHRNTARRWPAITPSMACARTIRCTRSPAIAAEVESVAVAPDGTVAIAVSGRGAAGDREAQVTSSSPPTARSTGASCATCRRSGCSRWQRGPTAAWRS